MVHLPWGFFALNLALLLCLLSGIYLALQYHKKPVLVWEVPLHLSYQEIGSVVHSRTLARYNADLWNYAVQTCGAAVATATLVAFQRYRQGQSLWMTTMTGPTARRLGTATPATQSTFGFDFRTKIGASTLLVCIYLGAQIFSSLLGMHPSTWTTTSPIGAVSTAAITAELTRVPAAAPWDLSFVMQRSAFEHVLMQKGHGALAVTHRYLTRHIRDELGVRIGRTVYPSIRTQGVGVAPAPWERRGYRVPVDQGRVLSYEPVVAATNVTVQCSDTTEDWTWGYEVHEFPSKEEPKQPPTVVHRFHVSPKEDWNTRGPSHTTTYVEGNKGINLETWLALKRDGNNPESANNMEVHQLFFFTNVGFIKPKPQVALIDCVYGGVDLIRQVTMTSPLDPISISDVIGTKDALDMEDLYPAATAIESALGRDGGAMVAGMTTASLISFEAWDLFRGRTLELPRLIENILVDTAQAYFSLVRQWREEAQFFSWPRDVPAGTLRTTTKRIGWNGGIGGMGGLIMLALMALFPLTALTKMSSSWYRRRLFSERFELRDGVIKKKED